MRVWKRRGRDGQVGGRGLTGGFLRDTIVPMNHRRCAAFTWVEVLIAIVVVGALAALLLLPPLKGAVNRGSPGTQILSNMKQLHLATQAMALDGALHGDTNLAWPGSQNGTFSNWAAKIVPAYLSRGDFCKLLSAKGVQVDSRKLPTENRNAVLVYGVTEEDESDVVFLTTANFTNTPAGGSPPLADGKPFGDKVFVVFRKGGEGAILFPRFAGDTKLVGKYAPLLR
jgi:type II secretory pathway pseudopilin PulG